MKNPRSIKYIVIHCTATRPDASLESIKRYWRDIRKWGDIPGYHYIIDKSGNVIQLLSERQNSNGVYAHNSECINVAYIGGINAKSEPFDTRTKAQQHAMFDKIIELIERYPLAKILGHRDFPGVNKACPSFDVRNWLLNYEPDLNRAA